jgi:hypothetical protein
LLSKLQGSALYIKDTSGSLLASYCIYALAADQPKIDAVITVFSNTPHRTSGIRLTADHKYGYKKHWVYLQYVNIIISLRDIDRLIAASKSRKSI